MFVAFRYFYALALALKLSYEISANNSSNNNNNNAHQSNLSIDDAFEKILKENVPLDNWAIWLSKQFEQHQK